MNIKIYAVLSIKETSTYSTGPSVNGKTCQKGEALKIILTIPFLGNLSLKK